MIFIVFKIYFLRFLPSDDFFLQLFINAARRRKYFSYGTSLGDILKLHILGKALKRQAWRNSYNLRNFYKSIHVACMLFFRFNTSAKKLFVNCEYYFLFACLLDSYGHLIQMRKTNLTVFLTGLPCCFLKIEKSVMFLEKMS